MISSPPSIGQTGQIGVSGCGRVQGWVAVGAVGGAASAPQALNVTPQASVRCLQSRFRWGVRRGAVTTAGCDFKDMAEETALWRLVPSAA